jgi:hypothetical protein
MVRRLAVLVFLLGATAALPAQAQERGTVLTPKQRERERKAMSAYAATRYQEALDLYADLYADFHDPLYLRNIGRCHQKLRHPEEAIASFQEYLSKYKRLSAAEIDEVQGWIAEMKELQKAMAPAPVVAPAPAAAPAPAPTTAPPAPAAIVAPAPAPAPAAIVAPAAPQAQIAQQAPPRDQGPKNVGLHRAGIGLIVTGVALAVAGGVFEVTAWNKFNSSKNGACNGTPEGCLKAADSVDQRALLSKLFFAGAAVAGLSGGALIYFFPVTEPGNPTAMAGLGASAAVTF